MNSLSSKKKQKRKKAEVYKVSSIDNYILLYYSCHFLNPVCVIIWDIFINIYIKFNFSIICCYIVDFIYMYTQQVYLKFTIWMISRVWPVPLSGMGWGDGDWGGGVEFNEWKITHTSMFKYITAVVLLMLMWE